MLGLVRKDVLDDGSTDLVEGEEKERQEYKLL